MPQVRTILAVAACAVLASVPAAGVGPSAAAPQPPSSGPTLTLAFAGDVHFEDELKTRLKNPQTALAPIASTLGAADVTVVNLETAITKRGTPEPKKFHFRTSPKALDALAAGGVDVVTMANNHAVDYGAVGLADTLRAKQESPIPVVGLGRNAKAAFAPAVIDVRGTSVAVFGATQVPDRTVAAWSAGKGRAGVASARDPDRLLAAVERSRADVVVVYLHYGTERVACPTTEQRDLVARLVAAGADAIVGAHTHVLLGTGWQGQSYVSYGLGNFIWYSPNSTAEATSGVLRLRVDGQRVRAATLVPTVTDQDGLPRRVSGARAAEARADWRALRRCAGLAARPPG